MNRDEKRVALAKLDGWEEVTENEDGTEVGYVHQDIGFAIYPDREGVNGLPDYLNDLNAIHRIFPKLDGDQQWKFIRILLKLDAAFEQLNKQDASRFNDREKWVEDYMHQIGWDEVWSYIVLATPEHLADAILKTLNLWTE